METLTIVVPVYNEQEVLPVFQSRLSAVLETLDVPCRIVYVDDGSSDQTPALLETLHDTDARVAVLRLSRNFGKEIALTAGLDTVKTGAAVVIDVDLQDPPEVIPELVKQWKAGFQVVYARRQSRRGDSFVKRITARWFYRLMRHIGGRVTIPSNTGDFRLLSRPALDGLMELREQHRFMKGLFAWIGFSQKEVLYERAPRAAGKTKWNLRGLWNLSIEGITSFTIAPLKVATYVGVITAAGAFAYGLYVIIRTLILGSPVPGYPSLMVAVLMLGGVQLLTIGIMGEYLGRIFNETKRRPLYLVREYLPSGMAADNDQPSTPDA